MATPKPHHRLADYVTMALSPILIMGMVGSLMFFLLEVFYGGQRFESRLMWTAFWFVVGIVLIARISMDPAVGDRASLYGGLLGLAVAIAMGRFFSLELALGKSMPAFFAGFEWVVNVGIIALVWWSAHKLTWDCTFIDDEVDASGQGLLEAAGLDAEAPEREEEGADEEDEEAEAKAKEQNKELPGLVGWWERYRLYREKQRNKPHTPGVWVVYYSFAALPLFGLGQALIPSAQADRRRYAFWLLSLYVACGLGLLLTTAFLGLRRYLRQRKLEMPMAMTGIWLLLGTGLIVVLMVIGALLPRPSAEYKLWTKTTDNKLERDASRFAVKTDGAGKGQGRASTDPASADQKAQSGQGTKPDKSGGGQTQGKSGEGGKGSQQNQGGQQGQGGQQSSSSGNNSRSERGNDQNNSPQSRSQPQNSGNKNSQADKRNDQSDSPADKSNSASRDQNNDNRGSQSPQSQRSQQGNESKNRQQQRDKDKDKDKEQQGGGPSSKEQEKEQQGDGGSQEQQKSQEDSTQSSFSKALEKLSFLSMILKWVLFAVIAAALIFFALRHGLKFLANFTTWAQNLLDAFRNWWANLFGGGREEAEGSEDGDEEQSVSSGWRPRPFAVYVNPFMDGSAQRMSPEELTRYTFDALQAWAWDRDLGRHPEETPLEFAERLGNEVPAVEAEVRGVAGLYARSLYARGRLGSGSVAPLQGLWQKLERNR